MPPFNDSNTSSDKGVSVLVCTSLGSKAEISISSKGVSVLVCTSSGSKAEISISVEALRLLSGLMVLLIFGVSTVGSYKPVGPPVPVSPLPENQQIE